MTEPADIDVTPAADEVSEQQPIANPDAVPEADEDATPEPRGHAPIGDTNLFTADDDDTDNAS